MKKLILLIGGLLFVQLCFSQDEPAKVKRDIRNKFMVGIKAGMNYSNVYDTEGGDIEADPKLGFVTGGFLTVPIGRFLGFHPEVLLSQKGYQASGSTLGSSYVYTRTTNYVDVPLLFAFKPAPVLSILAGPQYSYLVKQQDSFESSNLSVEQEREFENDNIRRNTLCFLGGADLNLNHFVFSGRVGWDVQNNNGDGTYSNPRYRNVWYQATFGYRFY
jgi:hypothetical protein